jgi:pyruvate,water dikinase
VLPSAETVRSLSLDELARATHQRTVPADLGDRREPTGRPLPARFRLDEHGAAWLTMPAPGRRRRRAAVPATVGVSAGVATGPVVIRDGIADGDIPPGAVLVVSHLDPRLAPVIPRLRALVAETGSALSHLAILAREYRVPAVVGLEQATSRFKAGQLVAVDGGAGTVELVERVKSEDIVTIRAAA